MNYQTEPNYVKTTVKDAEQNTAYLLVLVSVLYLVAVFTRIYAGEIFNLLFIGIGLFCSMLAYSWMSLGLKNKKNYEIKKYAVQPTYPLLFLASIVGGIGNVIVALFVLKYSIISSVGLGFLSIVGCWFWYGLDHVKSTHLSGEQTDELNNQLMSLEQSSLDISKLDKALKLLRDENIIRRLSKIVKVANEILDVLYNNPKKITKARKFLNTYLKNITSIVVRYSNTHARDKNKLHSDLIEVLDNAEVVFNKQLNDFTSNEVFDLDVDIEVLNTLLHHDQ